MEQRNNRNVTLNYNQTFEYKVHLEGRRSGGTITYDGTRRAMADGKLGDHLASLLGCPVTLKS